MGRLRQEVNNVKIEQELYNSTPEGKRVLITKQLESIVALANSGLVNEEGKAILRKRYKELKGELNE